MALKIKQKKKPEKQHLKYQPNVGEHWSKGYRERNKNDMRRSFVAILVVVVVIFILLITTIVRSVLPETTIDNNIQAADTFAISQMEHEQMKERAEKFAQGVLVYAYCSDAAVAQEGKTAALMYMASNTAAYKQIEELSQASPIVAPANFAPIVTEPKMIDPTQAYADKFTFEFNGVAVDTSVTSETMPEGTFVDKGYHFKLEFSYVADNETGESSWVISDASIVPNYSYAIYSKSNNNEDDANTSTNTSTTTTTTNTNEVINTNTSNGIQNETGNNNGAPQNLPMDNNAIQNGQQPQTTIPQQPVVPQQQTPVIPTNPPVQ